MQQMRSPFGVVPLVVGIINILSTKEVLTTGSPNILITQGMPTLAQLEIKDSSD